MTIIEMINIIDLKFVMPELTEEQLGYLILMIDYMLDEYP